jgi:hypothetical protein
LIFFLPHFEVDLNYGIIISREEIEEKEIPDDMKEEADSKRNELIEHLSNADETLGLMYLGT